MIALVALLLSATVPASAADPLHVRIDQLIESAQTGKTALQSTDAEFLRRISLDLTGTIPSSAEARKFLDDTSPDKRAALVDRLLGSPSYVRHMSNVFDIMLMERRADKHVKATEWLPYLTASFEQNKPFDQLAREILAADGVDPKQRASAKFYLDREGEPNLMTREVGRIFFGMDLQCAQCHDHPLIDDYLQADYYGIYAFLNRSFVFTDAKKKVFYAEKAEGNVGFKSVFTGESGKTRPRLPGGSQIAEPTFLSGDNYIVKPAKNVRPVPKYSRRAQLAKLATDGSNRAFNRNIANRLWAHMLGRGLVHPVDLHHPDNPASHPEVLRLLADEFAAMKFDIKGLLRQLALTRTYQRSFQMPGNVADAIAIATKQLPNLTAEHKQLATLVEQAEQPIEKANEVVQAATKALEPAAKELAAVNKTFAPIKAAADKATKAVNDVQKQLKAKQPLATSLSAAATKAQAAAKLLPNEKELQQAAQTFKQRADKATAEVAALTKKQTANTAAAKTASEKLAAARKTTEPVVVQFDAANKKILEADSQLVQAIGKLHAAKTQAKHAETRLAQATTLVGYGTALAAAESLQNAAAPLPGQIAAAKQAHQKLAAQLATATTAYTTAEKNRAAATQKLTAANGRLTTQQAVAKLIDDAVANLDLADRQIPGDADLKQATQILKSRATALAQQLAAAQKEAAVQAAAAKSATEQAVAAKQVVTNVEAAAKTAEVTVATLESQLKSAVEKSAANRAALDIAYEELTQQWTNQFSVAAMEPLSPEQLAWSVLQATGQIDRQRAAETAAISKKSPLKPDEQKDAAKLAARTKQIEQATYAKLQGNVAKFVRLFGAGAGQPQQDFFATVDQALFFANGGEVRGWLTPSGGNLTDRLNKLEDPKALADELYLSVLTRRPSDAEVDNVSKYLASRPKERPAAIQEIVWALLTSTEFRFDH